MTDDYSAQSHEAGMPPDPQQGQAASMSGTPPSPDGGQVPGSDPFWASGQPSEGRTPLGPGYVMDPVTGQLFYKVPVQQGVAHGAYGFRVPPEMADPAMAGGQVPPGAASPGAIPPGPDPQQVAPPPGPDYGEVIKSVEQFAEGEATVADVVKTLYTNTAQDDQFWKGALVGAAAAVLLTSGPVKETMGKTFGSLFGNYGAAKSKAADTGGNTAGTSTPEDKKE